MVVEAQGLSFNQTFKGTFQGPDIVERLRDRGLSQSTVSGVLTRSAAWAPLSVA